MKKIILFVIGMILIPAVVYAEIHSWIDENGVKHFGQEPPAGVETQSRKESTYVVPEKSEGKTELKTRSSKPAYDSDEAYRKICQKPTFDNPGHWSRGLISQDFRYDGLEIVWDTRFDVCYLEGAIFCESTYKFKERGISITFYAYTINDKLLWENVISIDEFIGNAFKFRDPIPCTEEPHKYKFKLASFNK